mmetsp:Transcript_11083/g.16584  ORF Transcript_11083/g.16584 Transcript_11083/m.16584 type:complete len:112 (-) Transcript_11083:245-580(-)
MSKIVGGFTSFREADQKEVGIVTKFAGDIAKKIDAAEFKYFFSHFRNDVIFLSSKANMHVFSRSFEVKGVKTQVVAGINYTFKVVADSQDLHVTIWGKLDQTHELTKVEKA